MPNEVIEAPAVPVAPPPPAPSPAPAAPSPSPAPAAPAPSPSPAPASEPAPAPVASKWSDTWREDMAGTLAETATEDEKAEHGKLLKRLQRFNSPADAAKALREQDRLISSGALKKALPKDAKPEQIAEWRRENGIPETPDKYEVPTPDNVELNDLDKQMLAGVTAKMHAANATPDQVKAGVGAYFEVRQAIADQMLQANADAKKEVEDTLRAEWGQEYRTNVDGIDSLLTHAGSEVAEVLIGARGHDGVQLMNNPAFVKWVAGHARELGFVGATVVPSGGDLGKSVETELAELRGQMGTPEWEKNAKGQARYVQLIETQKRLEGRNKK